MEKHVPNVALVHIRRMVLLLAPCVCPAHRNPAPDNQIASFVRPGRMAMEKDASNVLPVPLRQTMQRLVNRVCPVHRNPTLASRPALTAWPVNSRLPRVPPTARIVRPPRNRTRVQLIARIV